MPLINSDATLLEQVLEGKDNDFKARVLNLVVNTGLTPDDPVFLMLLATGRLEIMLEDAPLALEKLLKTWAKEFWRSIELVETATVERQKEAIAKAAQELIEQASKNQKLSLNNKAQPFCLSSFVPAAAVVLGAIALGAVLVFLGSTTLINSPTVSAKLSSKDAELLKWASSKDGQFARSLLEWNAEYLKDKQCAKDVQRLNVELTLGNKVSSSGFCVLWIEPPNKRQWK
ncbi:MAG TPA: hypothetical protein DD379_20830 [Cyanobacteria bacterium UBA11162]|nr:hypothetical protein [Cyanobacteria bacterium UBA11162]